MEQENRNRLIAMRWCYAAAVLLLCCVACSYLDSITPFLFILAIHGALIAASFLKRDVSFHTSIVKTAYNKKIEAICEQSYQSELRKKEKCWFDEFAVYAFEKETPTTELSEKPKLSKHIEQIWKDGFKDESNTIEFDVSVSAQSSFRPFRPADVPFEVQ